MIKKGDRVVAKVSGWTGTVVAINKRNPSSPYRVRWDRNGATGNHNDMTIRKQT